ncbi:helix-turn-helix transcriptional regulator [Sporosarcina sp. FSL K6-1508]|uniref:helix-turn-helix transcriptional regulator n=1 Tax=Sporosarcina sp. FSL K6-1508 TaxID=2921553 RepID=UPI0030F972BF
MNERLKQLRKQLSLNQNEMAERMNLSRSHISSLENGVREITDRIINDVCREFDIKEEWIRTGKGEMFVQSETFSLDEKAQKNNLTELEIDIIQSYMELNKETRSEIIGWIKSNFAKHAETAATVEVDPIEAKVESYRHELEVAKKIETSSASRIESEPS